MKRKRSFDEESFMIFLKSNYSKLNENWQDGSNIWGDCCTSVCFANQPKNRRLLYTRWKKNYSGIRNQIMEEKKKEEMVYKSQDDSLIKESATSSNSKSEIEKMMAPSYAMLQCSNCSVFFIFTLVTYDQCPLIDYLCSHCSLSSSDYQKRCKISKMNASSADDDCVSPLVSKQQKTQNSDHGYCEESTTETMANIDNFVNEVTVETSTSPCKTNFSSHPCKNDCLDSKGTDHVIYISDADKLNKQFSKSVVEVEKLSIEGDQKESNRYQFILSYSRWNQINKCNGQEFNAMCGKIFTAYFSQFELGCNLSYRNCHVNKSWVKGQKYISAIAVCKQDFCCKYIFTIDMPPKPDENIVVNISQMGSICHADHIENNIMKNVNTIISVDDPLKDIQSNQYENTEISLQESDISSPVKLTSNYYQNEPQQEDDSCDKTSDEDISSYSSDDDLGDEDQLSDIPDFDYSSHNQFTLDYKDWEKIMPSFDEHNLRNGWEKIFAGYFDQFDLGCILEFSYCRLRKPFSMDNSVYLSTFAKCQYENCSTFLFKITQKPIKGEIVIVDVYQQGCVSHRTDIDSPNKTVTHIQAEGEDVYYTVDNLPEDAKDPLDIDVSQVVTIETSHADIKGEIKNEPPFSGSDTDDDSYNIENQILPYELNSEGKMLEAVIHKFEINYEDWLKMKPLKSCKTLQPGWTDIFFQYFANLNLGCILTFSYCYANKPGTSRKSNNYLRIKSVCKYTDCCKYYFNMKREPKPGINAKIKAIQVGTIGHKEGEVQARFIRGKYRKELAKQLENTSAFEFYNKNRAILAESGYDSSRKKSLHVLRNIKIKKKKEESLQGSSSELVGNSNFDNFVAKIDDTCIRLL